MLQDPLDDNVVPIVEELKRRLPSVNLNSQVQGEDEENLGPQNDLDTSEENGITSHMTLFACFLLSCSTFMSSCGPEQQNWNHQFFKDFEYSFNFFGIHVYTL